MAVEDNKIQVFLDDKQVGELILRLGSPGSKHTKDCIISGSKKLKKVVGKKAGQFLTMYVLRGFTLDSPEEFGYMKYQGHNYSYIRVEEKTKRK